VFHFVFLPVLNEYGKNAAMKSIETSSFSPLCPVSATHSEAAAFLESGAFSVGCNYWASHAGTQMWSDWREDVVDADLAQLAEIGHRLLRVFPLWPDFQPLERLYTYAGGLREIRIHDLPPGHEGLARAGMDPVMMERFQTLCTLAEKHGMRLIVGLMTGWMSGRLYVPRALEGKNIITDPEAIRWQVRFVETFVQAFRSSPAIAAWDLGNECNCMGQAPSPDAAWGWTRAIASTIRMQDGSRPVVSGMHSLRPGTQDAWRIQDQGELTDFLTTHPYPEFTPFCNLDPIPEIRNTLHATAEGCYYGDIGGKPCFAEELGTLGPMNGSEAVAAAYLRTALWSLWANDGRALLWWCAFDQDLLEHAPYDWTAWERELGLIRSNREVKPAALEIAAFAKTVAALPRLPERITEAVCILTHNQDSWAAAFAAFILAKQAGFDLRFQYADQPLRDASFYLLPCLQGDCGIPRRVLMELIGKVRQGATLYISHRDAIIQPFRSLTGADVITRQASPDAGTIRLTGASGDWSCMAPSGFRLQLAAVEAEVLGSHSDGSPAFLRHDLGRGEVFFLNGALESAMSTTASAFTAPATAEAWRIYDRIARRHRGTRVVGKTDPFISVTEHPVSETERLIVAVNQGSQLRTTGWQIADGWKTTAVLHGPEVRNDTLTLEGNSAAVHRMTKPIRPAA
jgi:hypothetical protein